MFNDDMPETKENPPEEFTEAQIGTPPKEARVGDTVKGKVVRVGEAQSFIDFGGRSEGSIETSELKNEAGELQYKEGDDIEATVLKSDDTVALTLGKAQEAMDLSFVDAASESGALLEGTVKEVNKGGLVIDINGLRGFCPVAQIDLGYVSDPSTYVGKSLPFKIIQWEKEKTNLVVSRRAVLEEERKELGARTRAGLKVGNVMPGKVRRLAPFGAFIDLGGVEGLAHISELSLSRVANASDVVSEGDSVEVKIIKVEDLGGPKERISLSMKALAADPWRTASERFSEGATLTGTVVRLTDFGAFVELTPGIDGLVHVSELSHEPVAHPRDAVKAGESIEVKVLRVDLDKKRISLSRKALVEAPAGEARPTAKVGMVLEGTVASVKSFGVFVNLPSLGYRVSGLIPRVETGTQRGADLEKKFTVGDPIKAEIIQIDEQDRIKLSIDAADRRSEKADVEEYRRSAPRSSSAPESAFGPLAELLRPLKEKMENGR